MHIQASRSQATNKRSIISSINLIALETLPLIQPGQDVSKEIIDAITSESISIDDELMNDKEMLEDYLILTLNKAIAKATNVNESELAAVAKDGMPNIPGLDMFK